MIYLLNKDIQNQKNILLNSKKALYELFDKFEATPLFNIPQNSVIVNMDNITFGPGQYSITFNQKKDLFFKIIYYCILYFIFQKKQNELNGKIYERLLQYIINNDIKIDEENVALSQEEIKVYLVKFLHLLETSKTRKKVVVEQLNNLPQINVIFVALVKQIVGYQDLIFQQNAREIQKNLANLFTLEFDLLSWELLLFGSEFMVEIRQFEQTCEFAIHHEEPDVIKQIKQQFYLGESAYFKEEEGSQQLGVFQSSLLRNRVSTKIFKKQTMQSIQWNESQDENEKENEKENIDAEKEKDLQQFDLMLNSIKSVEKPVAKEELSKELSQSRDLTLADTNSNITIFEQPKPLIFHQSLNNITQNNDLPASTVRSNTNEYESNRNQYFINVINTSRIRQKYHKVSLDASHFSKRNAQLGGSQSVQQIKSDGFEVIKCKKQQRQRVPSFILNRMKQKSHFQPNQNPGESKSTQAKHAKVIVPKITFSYAHK